MIFLDDIIRDDQAARGGLLRLSVRALLRNLILIGQLSRSATRTELLAAYDGQCENQNNFYRLVPRGFAAQRDLLASDVEELSLQERVAFLKGASLLLGDRLRSGQDCICNMLAAVILPVAAYASLLREDVALARKTWKAFANIPRLCAEKLELERQDGEGHLDLRKRTFDQFIDELVGERRKDLTLEGRGKLAAERIEKVFRLGQHRRNAR
jgi:hypothetical protein